MEIDNGSEHQSHLLFELNQMLEQVMELNTHLGQPSLFEFCKRFAPKLLSSLEKSISMAKMTSSGDRKQQQQQRNSMVGASSPAISENSDIEFRKDMSKKRKTMMPKYTKQMRMNAGAAGGMDDGHSWRKYGQKVILGAKHPRSYFRCTHRHTQSCKATKQVQRSDEDPLMYDVTYHGTHTCVNTAQPATARHGQNPSPPQQQLLESFRTGLKVKTEGEGPVSFSFFGNGADAMLDNRAFCSPATADNCFIGAPCASSFFSPTTPESAYFQASPFRASSLEEGHYKLSSSELDVISEADSGITSPEVDLSFSQLEMLDLSADLGPFDDSSFFFP